VKLGVIARRPRKRFPVPFFRFGTRQPQTEIPLCSHLQFPLGGAFWTFCSFSSRFSAVATASGHFRSRSAKSRSLTITSPVDYRWWVVWPYDEILSASDRNSFFLFRSSRLARAPVAF
jgi:hypothetical protein